MFIYFLFMYKKMQHQNLNMDHMFYTSKPALCIYIGEKVGTHDYHDQAVLSNFSSTCLK